MGNEFYINQLEGLDRELENLKEETMNNDSWCSNDISITINGKTFKIPFSADVYCSLSEMAENEIKDLG